ncbi:MAG: glucose-6-phosphate isomerase [Candidatus Hydrogenedentota bacterium]
MEIKIDISRAKSSAVTPEHGITPKDLRDLEARIKAAHKQLRADRASKKYGFYDLYKDKKAVASVKKLATTYAKSDIDNLVVLGIGGSALGITTLFTALKSPYHNQLTREERGGAPKLFVMDNVDPDTFAEMLRVCPPEKTVFNVISKSGGTAETISQLLIVLDSLKKHLDTAQLKKHVVVTMSPPSSKGKASPLQQIQQRYKLPAFQIPLNVGGRFSIFSPVGLFPASVLGMNIDAMISGCRAMDKRTSKASLLENPAYLRAAVHYLLCQKKGKAMSVMLPYSDKLKGVSDWYCQLWAESIGKIVPATKDTPAYSVGQTPIKALGATDQHSQLQLYLEGPNDKLLTVLEETKFNTKLTIPKSEKSLPSAKYLQGKTMNQLMSAERRATVDALRECDRPVIRVTFPEVNESTISQFLYMLEVETAMAGQLFEIDAFDQPAVELIKVFTRKNMGEKV